MQSTADTVSFTLANISEQSPSDRDFNEICRKDCGLLLNRTMKNWRISIKQLKSMRCSFDPGRPEGACDGGKSRNCPVPTIPDKRPSLRQTVLTLHHFAVLVITTLGLILSKESLVTAQRSLPAERQKIVEVINTFFSAAHDDDLAMFHSIVAPGFYIF